LILHMKYYLFEQSLNHRSSMTAGIKARCDTEAILEAEGFQRLTLVQSALPYDTLRNKIKISAENGKKLQQLTAHLQPGDVFAVQLPLAEHTLQLGPVLAKLKRRKVTTVAIVHDLEKFRMMKAHTSLRAWKGHIRNYLEETFPLKQFCYVIAHNQAMVHTLQNLGCRAGQLVDLQIFDYLFDTPAECPQRVGDPDAIMIAGNMSVSKAGYAYALPADERVCFSIYGVKYDAPAAKNVCYHGAFPPDVMPFILNGRYGLVWDGPQCDTCAGKYGEYLRLNNPHKTSLYLAAGFPIIIWREAALAEFIQTHRVGICVDSLADLPQALSAVSAQEYEQMKNNAAQLSAKLRNGYFLKTALKTCGID